MFLLPEFDRGVDFTVTFYLSVTNPHIINMRKIVEDLPISIRDSSLGHTLRSEDFLLLIPGILHGQPKNNERKWSGICRTTDVACIPPFDSRTVPKYQYY
jgi:hypothetical protein